MANFKVVTMAGAAAGEVELADSVFAIEPNAAVMHAAVRAYLLNQRQGTQSTLTRTEVSGGGKKPWRQTGTGRARQGSTRSPQGTHGGVALGPQPRPYRTDLNTKVRRLALCSALSAKAQSEDLVVDYSEHDLQICIWILLEEIPAGLDRFAPGLILRITENARGNEREADGPTVVFHGQLQ